MKLFKLLLALKLKLNGRRASSSTTDFKKINCNKSLYQGKTLGRLNLSSIYGVNVTRITRQGIDLFATRDHRFQIGDRIMVVGPEDNVNRVSSLVGNSTRHLDAPNIATIFIGIVVGIIFGSIPISLPNMPVPLKLGIAGGPLIISILIGRFGYKFKLVSYTTTSANMMLREIGWFFSLHALVSRLEHTSGILLYKEMD